MWGTPDASWWHQAQPLPPKRSHKGLFIGLGVGGGLVVVLVIALVVVLTTNGGNGDGGGGSAIAQKWSVPVPDSKTDASTLTAFVTRDTKTLVRISAAGITGYDLATGKQKFNVAVPANAQVCAGTRSAPNGVAALVFGPDLDCQTVTAVDVSTGRRLWTAKVKSRNGGTSLTNAGVAAAGGKIYVATFGRLVEYDAKAGPSGTGGAAPQEIAPKNALCTVQGLAATEKLVVAVLDCGGGGVTLSGLSPSKLTTEVFSTKLSVAGSSRVTIVSGSPLVVHVGSAPDDGELRVFDDNGVQTKVISSRQRQGMLHFAPSLISGGIHDMNHDFPFQIVGTTLVAAVDKENNTSAQDRVAGINLQTGQWAWSKKLGSTEAFTLGTSVDDPSKVLALDQGGFASGKTVLPQTYLIDPSRRGATTKAEKLDAGNTSLYLDFAAVIGVNKEVLVLNTRTTGPGRPLIRAYGK